MPELFIWSLKSSGLLILFFSAYYFLFRNNTAFKIRRSLLLIMLASCALAPLLKYQVSEKEPLIVQKALETKVIVFEPLQTEAASQTTMEALDSIDVHQPTNWLSILKWIYLSGVLVSLLLFLTELVRILILGLTAEKDSTLGRNIFRHSLVKSPFSFGKWIFVPLDESYPNSLWPIISRHELAHIERLHSVDLIFARLAQAIIWYNPIIYLFQKELKSIHEAEADEQVLQFFDFKTYANSLVQVSLAGQQISIAHSFALVSSFSKRLKFMKTHKTRIGTTITSLIIISCLFFGILGWSALYGQEKDKQEIDKTERLKAMRKNPISVNSRAEALEVTRKVLSLPTSFLVYQKLPGRFENILEKLKAVNPEKEILFAYLDSPLGLDYESGYFKNRRPYYFGELNDEDKSELYRLAIKDTSRLNAIGIPSNTEPQYIFKLYDYLEYLEEDLKATTNYIMFFEPSYEEDPEIFDETEVDIKPEPVGGLEAFTRAIALDLKLPPSIDKSRLPDSIDFSVVVYGGKRLTNVNLLTELPGSDKKNKDLYLFFGQVMEEIQTKTRQFYSWKKGVKDGKDVRVRMKISIPTNYIL